MTASATTRRAVIELVDGTGRVTLGDNAGVRSLALWQTLVHGDRTMRPPLGRDYNADGKGIGFNVPSLQGIYNVPPFMHNGAAESPVRLRCGRR